MIAAAKPDDDDENPGGSGGDSRRDESGRSVVQNQRLLKRALRGGWLGEARWDTDATIEDVTPKDGEKPTARQIALAAVMRDMLNSDPRPRQIAVGNLIRMEQQNQADEHKLLPSQVLHRHQTNVDELSNEQLDRIIAGDFTAIEDASGGGAQTSPNGNGEPA